MKYVYNYFILVMYIEKYLFVILFHSIFYVWNHWHVKPELSSATQFLPIFETRVSDSLLVAGFLVDHFIVLIYFNWLYLRVTHAEILTRIVPSTITEIWMLPKKSTYFSQAKHCHRLSSFCSSNQIIQRGVIVTLVWLR